MLKIRHVKVENKVCKGYIPHYITLPTHFPNDCLIRTKKKNLRVAALCFSPPPIRK